ncbi:dienelactone hydrolase family protein [Massilia sp. W12]|uniref:alpha/beta hydrolase n=1 Tax=Massilia sp. W12 TaxID=3126507 RepID=UPI0030D327E1
MTEKLLDAVQRETGPKPQAAVIWLHGLGDSGHGFSPIVPQLDLDGCPDIRFIFPHAPAMPVTINNGYVMPAWYDIRDGDLAQREDEAGLRKSEAAIAKLIAREHARGIPYERIVLAGFSQGCAMTLQTGLRFPHRLAGLLGLSGYLPLGHTLANERHAANAKTPLMLMHGKQDPVVPIRRAEQSRDLLAALGYRVEWRAYPMEHTVIDEELDHISAWLRARLCPPAAQ